MGYSTEFRGILEFAAEASASQLAYLNTILGEDCREHPEWAAPKLDYIDLELTEDFSGIKWSGAEKTYHMVECVNLVLRLMQTKWPDFRLTGQLEAQGDEWDDRWILIIKDGLAQRQNIVIVGEAMTCPACGHKWVP